jgi:hypothetical protein
MARYDSGATYDSGVRYDEGEEKKEMRRMTVNGD